MKFSKISLKIIASTFLISFALSVLAHDAWVEPVSGPIYRILYGHKLPEAYKRDKVTSIKVYNASQQPLKFNNVNTKDGLSIKVNNGSPAMFALEFDNGYWVKVGNGIKNIRHSQMPEGTNPSHPLKYSKTIIKWQNWMDKPLGQRIEFIPVELIGSPKPGS